MKILEIYHFLVLIPMVLETLVIKIAKVLNETELNLKKLLRKEMMLSGIEKDGWYQ